MSTLLIMMRITMTLHKMEEKMLKIKRSRRVKRESDEFHGEQSSDEPIEKEVNQLSPPCCRPSCLY